jgi:hypothetical protein
VQVLLLAASYDATLVRAMYLFSCKHVHVNYNFDAALEQWVDATRTQVITWEGNIACREQGTTVTNLACTT